MKNFTKVLIRNHSKKIKKPEEIKIKNEDKKYTENDFLKIFSLPLALFSLTVITLSNFYMALNISKPPGFLSREEMIEQVKEIDEKEKK